MSQSPIAGLCILLGLTAACAGEPAPRGAGEQAGVAALGLAAHEAPPPARLDGEWPDEPPPLSRPAQPAAAPEQAQAARDQYALKSLRGSFLRAGARNVVAARGRVAAVQAFERALPKALGWGPEVAVATRLRIDVDHPLCGSASSSGAVTAWYVGGVLPDGRGVRTSQMMSDPKLGEDAVFWLENVEGELFLMAGRGSMLRPIDPETYEAENGGRIRREQLKGACQ